MKKLIREYFRNHVAEIRKRSLSMLGELIKVKTVNPGKENICDHSYLSVCGDESKAIGVLTRYFNDMGVGYNVYELIKGRGNFIATYGDGEKSLCVGCHLDVVPAGDTSLWSSDPFVMTEKDGKVFGRGVLDNKGPMVSCVMAMEVLKELNINLGGKLILAAVSGEECHEVDEPDPGINFLMEKGFLNPTFAIIPDVGENMRKIDIAEKGRLVFKVTSVGVQAHGSTPEKGVNAVVKMAHFIEKVEGLKLKYKHHPVLEGPSINLGIVKGGSAANSVADFCEVIYDVRFVPGQTADGIIEEFRKCGNGIPDGKFLFDVIDHKLPHEIDPENALVKVIKSNSKEILGFEPETFGMGGGTFAKNFNLGGIQAVAFGPGDANAFHVSNEYLDIKQMLEFSELIACISVDLLGTN